LSIAVAERLRLLLAFINQTVRKQWRTVYSKWMLHQKPAPDCLSRLSGLGMPKYWPILKRTKMNRI